MKNGYESATVLTGFVQGFNLAEMDSALFGGGSDPYVVLSADPMEVRTHCLNHELSCASILSLP
jgi:hypothetical protein